MLFRCGYCGKEYASPVERGQCEIACEKEISLKAEQEKLNKLNEEKEKKREEINNMIVEYNKEYSESFPLDDNTYCTLMCNTFKYKQNPLKYENLLNLLV